MILHSTNTGQPRTHVHDTVILLIGICLLKRDIAVEGNMCDTVRPLTVIQLLTVNDRTRSPSINYSTNWNYKLKTHVIVE